MAAVFMALPYILVNFYVLRWIFRWMGACHYLFQNFFFRAAFSGFYMILATSLLTGFLIKKPPILHRILKNMGNYFLGSYLFILLTIVFTDAARLVLKYCFHASWIHYRITFVITGLICTLFITAVSVYGVVHAWSLKVTPYEVTVDKKVEGIDSLKVVLAADLHFGYSIGELHAAQLASKINEQKPDLVLLAGDIFDNEYDAVQYPEEVMKSLKSIKARYGVCACWGNHDISEPILAGFTFKRQENDFEDPRMERMLTEAGIQLLEDETVLIDDKFYIVGRKDISRSHKLGEKRLSPARLTENLDHNKPIIFLDHQPKELQEIADAGADLDLCGHTHDGQIFPGNLMIHLFWENAYGYLLKDNMHNIVTSGSGLWGPNMRAGSDNEICSITIHFK